MELTAGLDLDGPVYAELTKQPAYAGKDVTGPFGLLRRLETGYGLVTEGGDDCIRAAFYEQALAACTTGKEFYSASFGQDPAGCSQRILELRDELLMSAPADFAFDTLSKCGARLKALAKVEAEVAALAPAGGVPDRLRALVRRIRDESIPCPVTSIRLTDAVDAWERLWQELFAALKGVGVEITAYGIPAVKVKGDLAAARDSVTDAAARKRKNAAGDGSVMLLNARSPFEAADAAAVLIKNLTEQDGPENTVVIAPRNADILDEALLRIDMPVSGSSVSSPGHPALQVLPLFLQLALEPVDPEMMREFLLLPVNPLPARLRRELVNALANCPAVDSKPWKEAVAAYRTYTKELGADEWKRADERIRHFLELKRFSGDEIPVKKLADLCGRVAAWAGARAHMDEQKQAGLTVAAGMAELVRTRLLLDADGVVSPEDMRQLLSDMVQGHAYAHTRPAQQGAVHGVRSPGAVLAPVKNILWWNATEKSVHRFPRLMWHGEEQKKLEKLGVVFRTPATRYATCHTQWLRPVQLAGARLILVSFEHEDGEPAEPHPLWHEILDGFTDRGKAAGMLTADTAAVITKAGTVAKLSTASDTATAAESVLPAPPELWQPDPAGIKRRDTESASSLEQLIGCPLAWVLNYQAGIRESDKHELPAGNTLLGRLAHEVLEDFLGTPAVSGTAGAITKKITTMFDRAVTEKAAVLDRDVNRKEKEDVKEQVIRAGIALAGILRDGGYTLAGSEENREAKTEVGIVAGYTDLLLKRTATGALAIIDLKWSGRTYRQGILEQGSALQLAVYARLYEKGGTWPATGYFIITNAELLTVHGGAFPGATVVNGPAERAVWNTVVQEVQRVRKGLEGKNVTAGIPEDAHKRMKDDKPLLPAPCRFCGYGLFCGVGREEGK